jgi:alkylation response protein AidB-like acyl-CoA dehydrogenase
MGIRNGAAFGWRPFGRRQKPCSASRYLASSLAIPPAVCQIRRSMDVTFSAELEAFRREARAWLSAHVPSEPLPPVGTTAGFEAHRVWEATLFADRWSAVGWPTEYGGRGLGVVEGLIFEEEYDRAHAPERVNREGLLRVGPTLLEIGTAAQKERYVLPIATGEEIWCRAGLEAAHDLAARAVPESGRTSWRLSGQKIRTSGGRFAQWCYGTFRTGPDAERHRGLTCFLIGLDAPGVTMRPLPRIDGSPGMPELSFDDVEVPESQVLGEIGGGWSVAMSMAGSERGLGLRSPVRSTETAARLIHLFEQRGAPPTVADAVARAYVDAQASRLHAFWTAEKVTRGEAVGGEVSSHEIFRSETDVAMHETALALLGSDAELLEAGSPAEWLDGLLVALTEPIDTATTAMQHNVVAERLLGLPGH